MQQYVFVSDLRQVGSFLWIHAPIKMTPRYIWTIAASRYAQ